MDCEPILYHAESGHEGPELVLTCDGPDDDLEATTWAVTFPDEQFPEGITMNDLRAALDAHAEAHPRDVVRPVRDARPKFKAGLGLGAATQIGASSTPTSS